MPEQLSLVEYTDTALPVASTRRRPLTRILITDDTCRLHRARSVFGVTNEELLRRYQAGGGRLAAANAEGAAVAPRCTPPS